MTPALRLISPRDPNDDGTTSHMPQHEGSTSDTVRDFADIERGVAYALQRERKCAYILNVLCFRTRRCHFYYAVRTKANKRAMKQKAVKASNFQRW